MLAYIGSDLAGLFPLFLLNERICNILNTLLGASTLQLTTGVILASLLLFGYNGIKL
jgi:hypothetical protein